MEYLRRLKFLPNKTWEGLRDEMKLTVKISKIKLVKLVKLTAERYCPRFAGFLFP